ncbi:hypothetical protein [Actinomadura coerulea]|uniref:hypothetical protein n=1 Tax=Actinomadura coerulea TaxID=46159 RepID=UPI00342523FB
MDDEDAPREPISDLDARRRERAGDALDPSAEADEAAPDDLDREWLQAKWKEGERAEQRPEAQPGPGEDERPGWRLALERSGRDHRAAFTEGGRAGLVDMYLDGGRRWWEIASVVVAALAVALAVFGLLLGAVASIVAGTYAIGRAGVQALVDLGVPQTIYRPVTAYLDGHSEGLPITAGQLAGLWLWGQVALLVFGFFGSWGARLGWIATGAATVAMVWAGTTPHASRWTAAGVAVLAWSVLSIVAFHGAGRGRRLTIISDAFDRPAARRPGSGEP